MRGLKTSRISKRFASRTTCPRFSPIYVSHPMEVASSDLITVVREDLSYLISDWPSGGLGDDEIRRSSTVLRRLFNYRDLVKV
jgi:hypothetical protein